MPACLPEGRDEATTPLKKLAVLLMAVGIALSGGLGAPLASADEHREIVAPLPISDHDNPLVRQMCWRIPACPLSILFLAPLIMVGVVVKAGGRHPAIITLAGGGTFAGFMVVLQPNAFSFILLGAVSLASLMLWRMVKT